MKKLIRVAITNACTATIAALFQKVLLDVTSLKCTVSTQSVAGFLRNVTSSYFSQSRKKMNTTLEAYTKIDTTAFILDFLKQIIYESIFSNIIG